MAGGSTCGGQTMAKATLLLALAFSAVAAAIRCPAGTDKTDAFAANDGTQWLVCEDLGAPDGGLVLVSGAGRAEHFSKTYEPYLQGPDTDYYLGGNVTFAGPTKGNCKKDHSCNVTLTGRAAVAAATMSTVAPAGFDILGVALLNRSLFKFLTYELVASALPPIAGTSLGSRMWG